MTLQISAGAFVLGLGIGLLVAMIKLKGPRWMVRLANLYTTLYRAVPELLLILLLYYAGTDLLNMAMAAMGRDSVTVNGFIAAVLVLGIVQGAYSAEIIRGAIQAIPVGQLKQRGPLASNAGCWYAGCCCPACCRLPWPACRTCGWCWSRTAR